MRAGIGVGIGSPLGGTSIGGTSFGGGSCTGGGSGCGIGSGIWARIDWVMWMKRMTGSGDAGQAQKKPGTRARFLEVVHRSRFQPKLEAAVEHEKPVPAATPALPAPEAPQGRFAAAETRRRETKGQGRLL